LVPRIYTGLCRQFQTLSRSVGATAAGIFVGFFARRGEWNRSELLAPVQHRSAQAQSHLMVIRARAGLVRARTSLINTARGLTKSYGERLRGCSPRNMNGEKGQELSPELQAALEPLLAAIESFSQRIYEQPTDREYRPGELSASGAAGTGEGSGNADRAYSLGAASTKQFLDRFHDCGNRRFRSRQAYQLHPRIY
jgi:hypothetical protein